MEFPKFRVIVIDYYSRWEEFSPAQEFDDYGKEILDAVDSMRSTDYERSRPIIMVGHSFGGLLIKKVTLITMEIDSQRVLILWL